MSSWKRYGKNLKMPNEFRLRDSDTFLIVKITAGKTKIYLRDDTEEREDTEITKQIEDLAFKYEQGEIW